MDTPLADIRIGQITSQWAESNHLAVNYKPQVESTNTIASEEAFTEKLFEESLVLYLTDHQIAGRGRGDNVWLTAKSGASLLSSWSFQLGVKPQPTISCLAGLALYRACSATWPFLAWNLKAPNDIYVGDKKIAGLLIESLIQGDDIRLIIGLGFNITAAPESIKTASSLVQSLPAGAPLLGQDYIAFLDRLLFELTDAVSHSEEPLSTTDQMSLLKALNQHPLLQEKYTGMKADGSLLIGDKQISWNTL